MSNLFPADQIAVKSPRLKWMEKYSIQTKCSIDIDPPWAAWGGDLSAAIETDAFGYGQTEDDALADWAKENNVKLWNEETI
jgi:hypothetical protein